MALSAATLGRRAALAIALSCLSTSAFAQTPGETRGPAGAANETNVLGEHIGCDRLCWWPNPFNPPGDFTCFSKLSTQLEVDNLNHAVSSRSIAVGKSIMLSGRPVTSGLTCGDTGIPVWGYVRAPRLADMTPLPPFRLNQVLTIRVSGVEPNQKDALFFPDPNTKDTIKPADADNK